MGFGPNLDAFMDLLHNCPILIRVQTTIKHVGEMVRISPNLTNSLEFEHLECSYVSWQSFIILVLSPDLYKD